MSFNEMMKFKLRGDLVPPEHAQSQKEVPPRRAWPPQEIMMHNCRIYDMEPWLQL